MQRIVVLGTSGSGKTTFARALAAKLDLPHIELDALHWAPNWTSVGTDRLRDRVANSTTADAWIIDGNYSAVRDAIWPRADTFIWLDYPMTVVATRVLRRTICRWWTQEELWAGNRERMRDQLFSKYSLFLWVVNTWRIHRRDYPKLLRVQQGLGKRVVRLRGPGEAREWLSGPGGHSAGAQR